MEVLLVPNPLSPDVLAILRLYLEKYDILAEEDKRLYRGITAALARPPLVMDVGNGATDDERKDAADKMPSEKPKDHQQ